MRYSFQSLQQNNFKSILRHSLYKLLCPLGLIAVIQLFFPQSKFAKDNWHIYSLFIMEAIQLFSISRDSINEIIIDSNKKILQINYYNFYQGQTKEKYAFSEIKIDISESRKKEVREINFFIKRKADFTLRKDKDNFSQPDLESLKELLYSITTPKKI